MKYDKTEDIRNQRQVYKVRKANEMIQKARYDLNITELKLLSFIISKVRPTDSELQEYTLSVKEFCQVCGIHYESGKNYQRIKDTLKGLRDKSFWIEDERGHETLIGWLQKARINKGSGKITVKLDEDMQKYVVDVQRKFTEYELLSTLPMRSAYSFRIYEMLKSYANLGSHTFDIVDLKKKLTAEHYENFKDFRRKVIEKAVKEINLYTDLEVSWSPIKQGNKVIQVSFQINKRDGWGNYLTARRAIDAIEGRISDQGST